MVLTYAALCTHNPGCSYFKVGVKWQSNFIYEAAYQELNMEETNVCEKCKYWHETGGTDEGLVGECRRNSPSPKTLDGAVDTIIRFAAWPAVGQTQWCGDYEKRPMETKEVLERMAAIEKMESARRAKTA